MPYHASHKSTPAVCHLQSLLIAARVHCLHACCCCYRYAEFVDQVAKSTATSHARSSVGKSPGSFKEIIAAILGPSPARSTWSMAVSLVAAAYHEQVQLDFGCFAEYYKQNFLAVEMMRAQPPADAWEHGEL